MPTLSRRERGLIGLAVGGLVLLLLLVGGIFFLGLNFFEARPVAQRPLPPAQAFPNFPDVDKAKIDEVKPIQEAPVEPVVEKSLLSRP